MSERFRKEYAGRGLVTICGLLIIAITLAIGAFLIYQGTGTFYKFHHSLFEFFEGGGSVGSAVYIAGSLMTCGLALLIATPFAIGAAVFMTEISPKWGTRLLQPAVEIFVGIPSVVYGWIGLTILVPFIRDVFHAKMGGYSVLAAGIVRSRRTRSAAFPIITGRPPTDSAPPDGRQFTRSFCRPRRQAF